jgi:hypothetical protein
MEPIDGTYQDTLTHQRDFHEKRGIHELFLCSMLLCSINALLHCSLSRVLSLRSEILIDVAKNSTIK